MVSTRSRVAPSRGRALLITLVYVVIAPGGELLFGENADHIKASAGNALVGLVLPMAVGILAVLIIGGFWGWRDIFRESPELRIHHPRPLRLALLLFALVVVAGLAAAPWGDWAAGVIALLILGSLLVGVGEELVFRGFLLVGARTRYSELGAFLFTCVLFGLSHGANVLTGQALGPTLGQITFAAILGACFYLLRRTSGLLVIPILVHGLIDVVSIVQAPPG